MARKKVKLQFIENDSTRRVTYKKRVKGLLKKTQELSILCGVDACAIVYGQYSEVPEIWPSDETEVRRVVLEYKPKLNFDQSERKLTQKEFLKQSLSKSEKKLQRLQRRNREITMENMIGDVLRGFSIEHVMFNDIGDLIWVIEDKLRTYEHRIKVLEENPCTSTVVTTQNLNLNSSIVVI